MIFNPFRSKKNEETLQASAVLEESGGCMLVIIAGDWLVKSKRTRTKDFLNALKAKSLSCLTFNCEKLGGFDSSFIAFLFRVCDFCKENKIDCNIEPIPEKPKALLKLSMAVPPKEPEKNIQGNINVFTKTQKLLDTGFYKFKEQFGFFGELVLSSLRLTTGKAHFRVSDLGYEVERAGPDALPIVALISFLVGLILAFVGAMQLAKYGSEIYVADLVGLAMVREMGAIMVAIVMSGRTGASYAAELGSMKINEEIAAYRTFGISPLEFLVIPRILALVAMFPLLTIFANFIGMLGGFTIAWSLFDINYDAYINRTLASLTLTHCTTGVGKSLVFGVIVAVVGCMKGMTCGDNSAAVGTATTSSVVTSITLIIVADAIFAVMFNIFNI